MSDQIAQVEQEALAALEGAKDADALQQWKSQFLGNRGAVRALLSQIGGLPPEERAGFGQGVNALKEKLTAAFDERENALRAHAIAQDLEEGQIDISLPGRTRQVGGLHPVTMMHRQFQKIWADMGFQVFRSREVEEDDINFTALNMPPHHPARDMQDTFYTDEEGVILRTHTSPGQIHAMRTLGENGTKAIRVILPGMVYRNEQITARSEAQFTQVEGLAIGRNIRMSDLKGTITEFAHRIYGEDVQVRYRASYFPFTEPSMEVDAECFLCGGAGCRVCKYTGWLEIAGSGMVHPNVLRNGGYDPSEWSGFAFGMGPERMTMLRHNIQDIRYFWSNDLRFLEQF
ncbi:phenylalanine--tRNA ligase subunit alpha [Phototrophicus methaneseepsis]|uniref:Phenylalanine--tRNA ligase alpha subunit n=1 Tax=Phototrophicus methaneseepsis TaxID=2710758 RepID=A0A7S8E875_9CHLR|nr:phenylalanine--tRNA ligase subunit alpha [Phototrophicus methaneseepsis]QPC82144.1 phenylalanine--tRNA ligase subunit alpha [Phototrophicus methaneseepsis]